MIKLKIITSTVRDGNHGNAIAEWFYHYAQKNEYYQTELIKLDQLNLPLMNEPFHPMLRKYQYEHTKRWSKIIDEADAFVIVLGEYNYGIPAPIKNAIDYLHQEWKYKSVGFVSYGGISAGLRSTQMMKQIVTTLSMMPIPNQVNIPFVAKKIDAAGNFLPDERIIHSAEVLLKELRRWAKALAAMRVEESTETK